MKKIIPPFIFLFFFVFASSVKADTILTINNEGEVIWNVLSSSDSISLKMPEREDIDITGIAVGETGENSKITLAKEGENINLNIASDEGNKTLNVTNWQDDLIEIEERGEAKKLAIRVNDGGFSLEQEGMVVNTNYPINIDPKKNEISVETPSGTRFLSILPIEAAEAILRAKVMTQLTSEQSSLVEGEKGELVYEMNGEKVLNLFNLVDYPVEVKTKVSALTGEIVSIDQPTWLKIISFLFG
ncbi:MAG: hypothetical protein P8Y06_01370 [Patescibacteria group bacterium]|jgi:hypothetical protein